jgi:hypothetical protein
MTKKRWTLFILLTVISLTCAVSVFHIRAANPTSGTMTSTSAPLSWDGTALGGTNNGEGTCVEGVNCDTFTLTVAGTPADWTGNRIQVAVSWILLANDYDVYIHKTDNSGPVVDQAAHGAPSTSEKAYIEPATDGTGVFTVHVVYFTAEAADQYHAVATVVPAFPPPPPPPPLSNNWVINYHGTCCEGNLAASGGSTYVLLPVLIQGNKIERTDNGGRTWVKKYPPVDLSQPFGIEGDLNAWGDDIVFFGTELTDGVVAHSDNRGESWTVVQFAVPFVANDQAWAFLGPFGDLRPGGMLLTDEPYVLTGWYRIGSVAIFSFDGGLTWPIQTPLVGNDGSGSVHVVCRDSAHAPNDPGDTRIPNPNFANKKAGHYGCWGTDRKFYWTEPADGANPGDRDLYVCKTDNFGTTWTGIKHPIPHGPAEDYVTSHSGFDNNGTLYVLHGNKLYVSFNQGESFAFVHTLPRWGNAGRSDSGADQFFVVDCGTIHIGLIEDAGEGNGNIFYLRGSHVDTASPTWEEELVDVVGNERLDFMQIVLDGNHVPTLSYTTPGDGQVTTASRVAATNACIVPVKAVSRKTHGSDPLKTFDIDLPLIGNPGIECRSGTPSGNDFQVVFTFAVPVAVGGVSVTSKDNMATADDPIVTDEMGNSVASGDIVTVNLHNVSNDQIIGVSLTDVNDGTNTTDVGAPMAVVLGDTTGNGLTNSSDVAQTQSQSGQAVNANNFREDVTVSGEINSSDIALVQSKSGTGLPGSSLQSSLSPPDQSPSRAKLRERKRVIERLKK